MPEHPHEVRDEDSGQGLVCILFFFGLGGFCLYVRRFAGQTGAKWELSAAILCFLLGFASLVGLLQDLCVLERRRRLEDEEQPRDSE